MKSYEIVGYSYNADFYCNSCMRGIAARAIADGLPAIAERIVNGADRSTEDLIDQWAARDRVDREDERSFDSGDFPKVVFADQCDGSEQCSACGASLIDEEGH